MDACASNSTRPVAATSVRNVPHFRASKRTIGNRAGCPACDMHSGRVRGRRALRHRAHRGGGRDPLAGWRGRLTHDSFGWVTPPVLNPFTRIAVEMCPATVTLRVVGYEIVSGGKLPQPATQRCEVAIALAT